MKEQLIDILKYVIAPVGYLSLAIFILMKVWNKFQRDKEEDEEVE